MIDFRDAWVNSLVPTPFSFKPEEGPSKIINSRDRIGGRKLQKYLCDIMAENYWENGWEAGPDKILLNEIYPVLSALDNEGREKTENHLRNWLEISDKVAVKLYEELGSQLARSRTNVFARLNRNEYTHKYPIPSDQALCARIIHRSLSMHLRTENQEVKSPLWPLVNMMINQEWLAYFHRAYEKKDGYRDHFFHSVYIAMLGHHLLTTELPVHNKTLAAVVLDQITSTYYRERVIKRRFQRLAGEFARNGENRLAEAVLRQKEQLINELDSIAQYRTSPDNESRFDEEFIKAVWLYVSLFHDCGYYTSCFKYIHDQHIIKLEHLIHLPHGNVSKNCFHWLHNHNHIEIYLNFLHHHRDRTQVFPGLWQDAQKADYSDVNDYLYQIKDCHVLFGFTDTLERLFTNPPTKPFEATILYFLADASFMHHYGSKGRWATSRRFSFRESPFAYLLRLLDELQTAARPKMKMVSKNGKIIIDMQTTNDTFKVSVPSGDPRWAMKILLKRNKNTKTAENRREDKINELSSAKRLFDWMSNDNILPIDFEYESRTHTLKRKTRRYRGKWNFTIEEK